MTLQLTPRPQQSLPWLLGETQYFISSCRISQSYFQSLTCHCRVVALRQLVVIMAIYSPESQELQPPNPARPTQPKQSTAVRLPHSVLPSSLLDRSLALISPFTAICPTSSADLLQVCSSHHLCHRPLFILLIGFSSKQKKLAANYFMTKMVNGLHS